MQVCAIKETAVSDIISSTNTITTTIKRIHEKAQKAVAKKRPSGKLWGVYTRALGGVSWGGGGGVL